MSFKWLGNGSRNYRDYAQYSLPLISPELAVYAAATAEHLFPLLLLIGLGTRFSALALLGMTAVIQLLVYPDAWPVHGTWATILLYLAATGPGHLSVDAWIKTRFARVPNLKTPSDRAAP
ncbi:MULTISPECIES: DoxX family protein [Thiorhodovibrio]|uniref:DoxX family protein n=1 Tax=Thiorhodovibrio TaxID=61593 RepID=UPI0019143EB4|nr:MULTISPECIES: DoxX family protein [Thiorhodovibrio]MBK5970218.1 hypothetical protein [Thiorhodovibrio winogradskyi]WPL12364.1 DoxX [Thiorhodovibrio litoralis]